MDYRLLPDICFHLNNIYDPLPAKMHQADTAC